jgi:TRAP-type C4-dicarboxylate transport system permease small subunit
MDSETVATTSRLDVISRVMDKILSYIVAVLLVAMSGIVFGNVFSRYFLNTTLGWYEEVSRLCSSGSSFWGPSSP